MKTIDVVYCMRKNHSKQYKQNSLVTSAGVYWYTENQVYNILYSLSLKRIIPERRPNHSENKMFKKNISNFFATVLVSQKKLLFRSLWIRAVSSLL
jgi:hypothetical protein